MILRIVMELLLRNHRPPMTECEWIHWLRVRWYLIIIPKNNMVVLHEWILLLVRRNRMLLILVVWDIRSRHILDGGIGEILRGVRWKSFWGRFLFLGSDFSLYVRFCLLDFITELAHWLSCLRSGLFNLFFGFCHCISHILLSLLNLSRLRHCADGCG